MEEKYIYMVNLNKKRVVLLSLSFLALFSISFFIGMAIGVQTADMGESSAAGKNEISFEKDLTSTVGRIEADSPGFINREVSLQKDPVIASSHLLEGDKNKLSGSVGISGIPAYKKNLSKKDFSIPEPPKRRTIKQPIPAQPKKKTKRGKKYYIQLLLSREKKRAEYVLTELLKRKYKGYMLEVSHKGKTHYVVRVGLYSDPAKLKKDLNILRLKGGYTDAYVKELAS